jgi:hypothetical protein
MTLSKNKINKWYSENNHSIDLEIDKIIQDMKNNISIPKFIPYTFSFNEEGLQEALKVYLYKKYALNLR